MMVAGMGDMLCQVVKQTVMTIPYGVTSVGSLPLSSLSLHNGRKEEIASSSAYPQYVVWEATFTKQWVNSLS
eukprot:4522430-Amphidinium_carterae.1